MELWFAPPAYYMGILKEGGWAEIEVEISRSGQVLRVDLLGQQGHPSLIRAAESAVRAAAPTAPLPSDFPEPTLILRIRMFYPQVRQR
jgi:TonB family protein